MILPMCIQGANSKDGMPQSIIDHEPNVCTGKSELGWHYGVEQPYA